MLIKKAMSMLPDEDNPIVQMKKTASMDLNPPKLSSFARNQMSLPSKNEISQRETMASMAKNDEDNVFERFFLLCDDGNQPNQNKIMATQERESFLFKKPEHGTSCFYRYLCCCLIKQEEDYYSHF